MLEFLSNLEWYQWVLGVIALLIVAIPTLYFIMAMLMLTVFYSLVNPKFGKIVMATIFGSSALYLIYLMHTQL